MTKMADTTAKLLDCIGKIPGLRQIVKAVLFELGIDDAWEKTDAQLAKFLKASHILRQDMKMQASFGDHEDDKDLWRYIKNREDTLKLRTVVVQLSSRWRSGMRMVGYAPHTYQGRGAAVAFHGAVTHGTMRWKNPQGKAVWKVAFFFLN